MKKYEKEALLKIFSIFFIALAIFTTIIAFLYLKEQKQTFHTTILLQMKEFNYSFKNKKFTMDIIPFEKDDKYFILQFNHSDEIYSLFPIKSVENKSLKVIYPIKEYRKTIDEIEQKILIFYILTILFLLVFSFASSFYALHPMKKAIKILDEFFKDIVHDLNTPITSILLNTKLISKTNPSEELEKIELSTKRISDLYKNFELISNEFVKTYKDKVLVDLLINERVGYFSQIYPNIKFELDLEKTEKTLDKNSFIRIIDNIISNSCKYNNSKGTVFITLDKKELIIKDTGIGMQYPQKIFDRYYKETSRGIGIGMNIVHNLCKETNIDIKINSKLNNGTTITLTF